MPNDTKEAPNSLKGRLDLQAEMELITFARQAANVGYWVWDRKTDFIYLTETALKMLGQSKADFSNDIQDIKTRIHPDDYETVKANINAHIRDQEFFEIEFRIKASDDHYIWINIDGRPAPETDPNPHRIGGSVVDATAYVALKKDLEREKDNLRMVFDNVPSRIWLKDAHNKIIRLNQKAAESMNMKIEDVEGADTYKLFPEMAKSYHEADLAVINSGQPLLGIVERYTPIDGPHGWVSTDKLPFTHPETKEKFVLVISTDVTQQKEYETQILLNTLRLDQANKDLDHFAYMASHDLKAPLRGMNELTNWIEEDLGDALTPDIKEKTDLLRGRVDRMDALLKDILAFSRAGKNMAEPEVVEMAGLVDVMTEWLSLPEGFKITKDTDLPTLFLPRSALQHIVLNLLSNAIKHHDKPEGVIRIGSEETPTQHLIYVADDGPGIPQEYQTRVFEVFKQLKPRDTIEGSGIGLSIVKKMTEALGGKVEILSKGGQRGTRFNVYLPKS